MGVNLPGMGGQFETEFSRHPQTPYFSIETLPFLIKIRLWTRCFKYNIKIFFFWFSLGTDKVN